MSSFAQTFERRPGDLLVLTDQNFVCSFYEDVGRSGGSHQELEVHLSAQSFGGNNDCLPIVEIIENLLAGVPQGLEKHRDRKFPSAIDSHVEAIFGIEFEIDPGALAGE